MTAERIPIRLLALSVAAWVLAGHLEAAQLKPKTILAWREYVRLTEKRIEKDLSEPSGDAAAGTPAVMSGAVTVSRMETLGGSGDPIPVPSGLIHHWKGAVLIPEVRLEPALRAIRNPAKLERYHEDVVESGLLERRGDVEVIYLKLRRSQAMVEAAYNTEHRVEYHRPGKRSASSRSVATKIAEIVEFGESAEHERPPGDDRGYLWRLNAYWRYSEVEEGVLVTCEALILSRGIPFFIRFILRPFVDGVARQWMERTLESLRSQVLSELRTAQAP